jgi:hypothetical protein
MKKKNTIKTMLQLSNMLFLLFFCSPAMNKCHAQTIINGGTTTWNSSSNPGTITDDLILENNATLTIDGYTQTFQGDIYVQPGCTLNIINSAVVYFNWQANSADGALIVEADATLAGPGGYLYVNGSELTGDFDTYQLQLYAKSPGWAGIYVAGIPNQPQSSHFGKAYIVGSTIDNATTAVSNFNYKAETNTNIWALNYLPAVSPGGIIQAKNTDFTENEIGAFFANYTNHLYPPLNYVANDQSYFQLCTFNIDNINSLFDPNLQLTACGYLVSLNKVQGIRFYGCAFKSTDPGLPPMGAIYAQNAGFTVDQFCTGIYNPIAYTCSGTVTQSLFQGFNTFPAIQVNNSNSLNPVTIQNSDFEGNAYAIYLTGCGQTKIFGNTINEDISVSAYINNEYVTGGINLENCSGFSVQSNTVNCSNAYNGSASTAFGIVVVDAGPNYNAVGSNTCSNMGYAIQSVGKNRSYNNTSSINLNTGLEFLCNSTQTTLSPAYDYTVFPATTTLTNYDGVNPDQGYMDRPTYNVLTSRSVDGLGYNITNECHDINYYHYSNSATDNPNSVAGSAPVYSHLTPPTYTCAGYFYPGAMPYGDYVINILTPISQISTNTFSTTVLSDPYIPPYTGIIEQGIANYTYYDSIGVNYDSVELILSKLPYMYDWQVQLAGLYVQENRFSDAITLLNGLPATDSLDSTQTANLANLAAMYAVMEELYNNGYSWSKLTNDEIDSVYNIDSTDHGYAKAVSHYLLASYANILNQPRQFIFNGTGGWARQVQPIAAAQAQKDPQLYPNPATDLLNIVCPDSSYTRASVSDVAGRLLQQQALAAGQNILNIQGLSPGMYFINIYKGAGLLKTYKLVKQ